MKKILCSAGLFLLWVSFMNAQNLFSIVSPASSSSSIYICWESQLALNPKVCDYAVYVNGKKLSESAREQAFQTNCTNAAYRKAFYDYYTSKLTGLSGGMVKTDVTFFKVNKDADGKELSPDTEYSVSVEAVNSRGKKLYSSSSISVRTKNTAIKEGKPVVLDVSSFGAESSEKITSMQYGKRAVSSSQISEEKSFIKKNTEAIQKAIDSCPQNGTVYIPYGIFMCGQLKLKSDMTLKIDGVLCSSPFAEHYENSFFMYEYYTDRRRWGLLTCDGAKNLTITGTGTVDGNGFLFADSEGYAKSDWQTYRESGDVDFSRTKVRARQLVSYAKSNKNSVYDFGILAADCCYEYLREKGVDLRGASDEVRLNAYASRSTTVILRNVENLLIEDLLFINPANHTINIINGKNITVTGITQLTYNINNGDGIGLCCTEDAWLFNNFLDNGDDSIVFSAGVGKAASWTGQTGVKNVEVFGNYIHHGHGGVAFGSHTALGISNVNVHDNIFNHTDAPFRIKSAPVNGGFVKDIVFKNNALACVKQPFVMTTEYEDPGTASKYGAADSPAVFSSILCQDCTVYDFSGNSIYISGEKNAPHHDIHFKNVVFSKSGKFGEYIYNCNNYTFE